MDCGLWLPEAQPIERGAVNAATHRQPRIALKCAQRAAAAAADDAVDRATVIAAPGQRALHLGEERAGGAMTGWLAPPIRRTAGAIMGGAVAWEEVEAGAGDPRVVMAMRATMMRAT